MHLDTFPAGDIMRSYGLILLLLLSNCQSSTTLSSSAEQSAEHLKGGLQALDVGDNQTAEEQLKAAIAADPLNSRAITALSSLYALQAGVSLSSWLDPFWESARQLDARAKYFEQSVNTINVITSLMNMYTPEQDSVQARIKEIANAAAQATLGLSVILDVFKTIPYLDDAHMVILEKAIQVLRIENVAPQNWDEEQRVYLSILSVVRLVNHVKRTAGDSMEDMNGLIDRLCRHKPVYLANEVSEIKKSLRYLEEGLTVNPLDPDTVQRQGRKRFQGFVTNSLSNKVWDQLNNLFDRGTPDGKIAEQLSANLCKNRPTDSL